ncbi:MAG: NifU family protein [Acidimicrobiia bacterium]
MTVTPEHQTSEGITPESGSGDTPQPGRVLEISPIARDKVLRVRAQERDPDKLALWLEVTGAQAGRFTYDMYFQPLEYADPDDTVELYEGLTVVVPQASVDSVRGAVLDVSGDPIEGGLVLENPNTPARAGGAQVPTGDLSGEVAQRVLEVLEVQVNPGIAAHGGRADLVAVEEGTAYLRLSGGCQGCGLATVTLSQGIEVAIKDQVPEITRVVDVTDHASGSNPYFEGAKK